MTNVKFIESNIEKEISKLMSTIWPKRVFNIKISNQLEIIFYISLYLSKKKKLSKNYNSNR